MVAAISNTPGPNFAPTSITRMGNCSSPGFMFFSVANSLKIISIASALNAGVAFIFSINAIKKSFLASFHFGFTAASSHAVGALKK